jgi:shikimate kinase
MGVGKTTVGRLLAEALELPFVDVDDELVRRYGSIPGQFAAVGEAGFRARERAALVELCRGAPVVLATGGGAWVDPQNRQALSALHRVVLTAPLDVLQERVGEGSGRPLWGAEAEELLRTRAPAYADADWVVNTVGLSAREVAEEVLAWLATCGSR